MFLNIHYEFIFHLNYAIHLRSYVPLKVGRVTIANYSSISDILNAKILQGKIHVERFF